jgi:MSHA biogenesis protein MshM
MEAYIAHRLKVAGADSTVNFDQQALRLLYQGSGGIPRLINILAHKSLLLGFGRGLHRIGVKQVRLAIADTEGAHRPGFWQNIRRRLLSVAVFGAVAAAAVAFNTYEQALSI